MVETRMQECSAAFHFRRKNRETCPARALRMPHRKDKAPDPTSGSGACGAIGVGGRQTRSTYMWSIITWPKPEQLTWVAPSSRRAKS